MTSPHTADVTRRLTDFLDRRQAPRAFVSNESAKADQIAAYLGVLTRSAPAAPALDEWWGRFLDALSDISETWAWPSEKEVRQAVRSASGNIRRDQPGDAWKPDDVEINLGRLARGEPVGDYWLWGRGALRLVAAGADRGVVFQRRLAMASAMADVYGIEKTRSLLDEMRIKHERAESDLVDWQRHQRELPDLPSKRPFSIDELERLVA